MCDISVKLHARDMRVVHACLGDMCLTRSKAPRWMTTSQTMLCLVALACFTVGTACFSHAWARRPNLLYSIVMTFMCVTFFLTETGLVGVLFCEAGTFYFRFTVSANFHKTSLVVFWNLLYVVCAASTVVRLFPHEARMLIIYQVWNVGVIVLLSMSTTRSIREDIRNKVEKAMLMDESSGLWNLLDLVCDVVITMDAELRITDKVARLVQLRACVIARYRSPACDSGHTW